MGAEAIVEIVVQLGLGSGALYILREMMLKMVASNISTNEGYINVLDKLATSQANLGERIHENSLHIEKLAGQIKGLGVRCNNV